MASYHLSVKPVSRATGRSATAAAAYRSAALIACEREGRVHDYTRRSGVLHSEIIFPVGAMALDRSALWNAAEAAEKRKDARVAREFEIALPLELPPGQRLALAKTLAVEIAERHGCAVDVAVHAPGRGDDRNHHAHLLTTTRRLGPEGLGAKCRELDDNKTGPDEIQYWRARWADLQNQALEQVGAEDRVTHRARTDQEIEAGDAPTHHLGPIASALERRGVTTLVGDLNRAIEDENRHRKLKSLRELLLEREGQIQVKAAPKIAASTLAAIANDLPAGALQKALEAEGRRIQAERGRRLQAIAEKAAARAQRRQEAVQRHRLTQPPMAAEQKNAQVKAFLEREHTPWSDLANQLQRLVVQAQMLSERLRLAMTQLKAWTVEQLHKRYPEAMARFDAAKPSVRPVAIRTADAAGLQGPQPLDEGRVQPESMAAAVVPAAPITPTPTPTAAQPPAEQGSAGVVEAGQGQREWNNRRLTARVLVGLARAESESVFVHRNPPQAAQASIWEAVRRYGLASQRQPPDIAEQQLIDALAEESLRYHQTRRLGRGAAAGQGAEPVAPVALPLLDRYLIEARSPETQKIVPEALRMLQRQPEPGRGHQKTEPEAERSKDLDDGLSL